MSGRDTPQPLAAAFSEPAYDPAPPRTVVPGEQTSSLRSLDGSDGSDSSDARRWGVIPEQLSSSDALDGFETAAPPVSAEQTSSSASSDSFAAPPRRDPTPRPTPRAAWIGTTHARRLLDVGSENTIKNWVRYGYLRGRRLPNGRVQVLLEDVHRIIANPAILQS